MKLPSPHAETIINALKLGEHRALNGAHESLAITAGDFDRGMSWLIHFGYLKKYVRHGTVFVERIK